MTCHTSNDKPRRENTYLPSKNRVGVFSSYSTTRARFFETQPLEPHQENPPTTTATVSGMRFYGYRFYSAEMGRWINRDPIGDTGFKKEDDACTNNDVISESDPVVNLDIPMFKSIMAELNPEAFIDIIGANDNDINRLLSEAMGEAITAKTIRQHYRNMLSRNTNERSQEIENLYRMVCNSPVQCCDILGLQPWQQRCNEKWDNCRKNHSVIFCLVFWPFF